MAPDRKRPRTGAQDAPPAIIAKLTRTIDSSPEALFDTVADFGNYGKAIPEIAGIEFLSAARTGVGARFRETRRLTGLKALLANLFTMDTAVFDCTEFVADERVRYTGDHMGALWHSVFTVAPVDGGRRARLELRVETEAYSLLGRLGPPFLRSMVRKGMAADIDAVKAYVEGGSAPPAR